MKIKKICFYLVLVIGFLSFLFLSFDCSLIHAEENFESRSGSKYLNVYKNSSYQKGTEIKVLNSKDMFYIPSLENSTGTKCSVKKGQYGFTVNGEFHLDNYKFVEEGIYLIKVFSYYYNSNEKAYKKTNEVLETFYLYIITLKEIEINTDFYYQLYLNANECCEDVKSEFAKLNVQLSNASLLKIRDAYNAGERENSEKEIEISENGVSYTLHFYSTLNLDNSYEIAFSTPITIDLNYFTSDILGKNVSEVVDVYKGITVKCPSYMKIESKIRNDVVITRSGGSFELEFIFTNNIDSVKKTVYRKVYIFNSYSKDELKPVIEFDGPLEYAHISDITYASLYEGLTYYDRIYYNSVPVNSIYGLRNYDKNIDEIVFTNFNDIVETIDHIGEYEITYYLYDLRGLSATYARKLIVKDSDAPKILSKYNVITIDEKTKNSFDIRGYYRLIDNVDRSFKEEIEEELFDTYAVYTITVSDSSNNKAEKQFLVQYKNFTFYEKHFYPAFVSYKRFWVNLFGGNV